MSLLRAALVSALLVSQPWGASVAYSRESLPTRKATITWRAVKDAVRYEFELSATPEMEKLVHEKTYQETQTTLSLKPGTYYFRVRGLDKTDSPGPWSDVQGFVVNPAPPELLAPPNDFVQRAPVKGEGIVFTWKPLLKGTSYVFELSDSNGVLIKRSVNRPSFTWLPKEPGNYRWRVGFEAQSGEEWGKPRALTVGTEAFPKVVVAPPPAPPVAAPRVTGLEDDTGARAPEWWLIGRGGQAILAYTFDDKDLHGNSSGAGVVGFLSAEARWRGGKKANQKWTWSGSLNLELIRQQVLGTLFQLPRGYARVFYGQETGRARIGPFLQFNAGRSGVFLVQDSTRARKAVVTREGIGAGAVVTYRAAQNVGLSALAVLRREMGGAAAQLPNPLNPSLGFEAGFGSVLNLSPDWLLEGRLRALYESYSWKPAAGGAQDSSMGNTFIILDLGLGYRF
jgi:hypothetical protein